MSDLAAALMVAIRVHAGQVDKQRDPYLLHVLRVVEAVPEDCKVVAALHDVCEDGNLGIFNVADEAGLGREELAALASVTRVQGATYVEYIRRIYGDKVGLPIAREVKLADLRDHLDRMPQQPVLYSTEDLEQTVRHEDWIYDWSGLKRRYTNAIATLEGSQG